MSALTTDIKTKTAAATRDKTAITGPLIRHQMLFNGSTQKAEHDHGHLKHKWPLGRITSGHCWYLLQYKYSLLGLGPIS